LLDLPADAALASEASGQRGNSIECARIARRKTRVNALMTLALNRARRRATGAPFVAWFSVRPSEFRVVSGEPSRFRSSAKATRSFCAHCGTQLTFQGDDLPDEVDVTTCSLDHPEQVAPTDHIHTSSKVRWIHSSDGLPQHPEARPDI
jgi:hypothetical protein